MFQFVLDVFHNIWKLLHLVKIFTLEMLMLLRVIVLMMFSIFSIFFLDCFLLPSSYSLFVLFVEFQTPTAAITGDTTVSTTSSTTAEQGGDQGEQSDQHATDSLVPSTCSSNSSMTIEFQGNKSSDMDF
jgi:hypothetical protein